MTHKPGRRKGSRNGESLTAKAVRYMHEHGVSATEAARVFGIRPPAISAAMRKNTYDQDGHYVGMRREESRSGKAAAYCKENEASFRQAADKFGISHQAVQQSWSRMPLSSRCRMGT